VLALADLLPIPKIFWDSIEWFAYNQFPYLEYVEEIQGIAKQANIPFAKLFFMNFAYEISTISAPMCTSILVRDINGTIIHGRNLDFEMFNIFSRLIARVEFFKGEVAVF
jgi:acid ceramidase/N-acylethanolamine-hydrolysing acid amidase